MITDQGTRDRFYNPATESIETKHLDIWPEELRVAYNLFDIQRTTLPPTPKDAPSIVNIGKFWRCVVPGDFRPLQDREDFLGFDYDVDGEQVELTERTEGNEHSVPSHDFHLILLHSEPMSSRGAELSRVHIDLSSVPMGHAGDLERLIVDPNACCSIIIGAHPESSPVLVLLKTGATRMPGKLHILNDIARELFVFPEHPIQALVGADRRITKDIGLAVYRGFTSIPPTGDVFLRRR